MVAERRIFFLGVLPGRSGRLPPFLRPYVCTSVPRAGPSRLVSQPLGARAAPSKFFKFQGQMHLLKLALYEKTNAFSYVFVRIALFAFFRLSSWGELVSS